MAVVDLRMPGPSGLELVRDLKALDPATRIVVLTGYGSIATAIEAVRIGATYYLQKPADVDDILAAFARRRSPAARSAAERLRRALARARRVGAHQPRALGLRRQHLGGGAPTRAASQVVAAEAAEVSAAELTLSGERTLQLRLAPAG